MIKLPAALLIVFLMALATTTVHYLPYGSRDQAAELPVVKRLADDSYLAGDFFVDQASAPGPRYLYAYMLARLSRIVPLHILSFLLTLLINLSIGLITLLFVRGILRADLVSGLLASALILGLTTFKLGYYHYIYARQLLSSSLVFPLILISLWYAFRQKSLGAAFFSGLGIWIHPTFAAEGWLISFMVILWLSGDEGTSFRGKITFQQLKRYLLPWLLVSVFALVPVLFYLNQSHIPAAEYVNIETRFRHPHHNMFGYLYGFDQAFYFLLASWISWRGWLDAHPGLARTGRVLLRITLVIVGISLLTAALIQLIPLKIIAMARPFRLLFIVKWLGLAVISCHIVELIRGRKKRLVTAEALVLLVSLLTPFTMAFSHVVFHLRKKWADSMSGRINMLTVFLSYILTICWYSFFSRVESKMWIPVLLFGLAALIPIVPSASGRLTMVPISVLLILALLPFFQYLTSLNPVPAAFKSLRDSIQLKLSLADRSGPGVEVSHWAAQLSDEKDLFLIPSTLESFRLISGRSVVVDWKAFPFQDTAAREWLVRFNDCYGPLRDRGYRARKESERMYRNIDPMRLQHLKKKYNLKYAILFSETPSQLPVLYRNVKYKLVSLD